MEAKAKLEALKDMGVSSYQWANLQSVAKDLEEVEGVYVEKELAVNGNNL